MNIKQNRLHNFQTKQMNQQLKMTFKLFFKSV